jgi:uncharacterized membrane protein YbhN (UPF0104 family)
MRDGTTRQREPRRRVGTGAVVRSVLSGLLVAAILFFLLRSLRRSWSEAGVYAWGLSGWWLAASLAALAVYFPLVAWIWGRIVRAMGDRITLAGACRVWFLSQFGKYVPGKIWYAMGRLALCRREGVGLLTGSVSTLLELLLVILAACAVFLASLPLWPVVGRRELVWAPAAIGGIVIVLHPAVFGFLLRLGLRILGKEAPPYRVGWRPLAVNTAWYALSWIVYGAGLDFLLRSLRLGGAAAEIPLSAGARILFLAGASAVAWAAGFVSFFAPGGLGVREAIFAYFLSLHLPPPFPVLLALVSRIWIVVGEVGSAAVGWILGGNRS